MSLPNPPNVEYSKCHLVCHWGGEIVEGPEGINYKGGEVHVLLVNSQMKFSEVVNKIYELTKIDKSCEDLNLKLRFPIAESYKAVPLHDDNSLSVMWSCITQLSKYFIELYIEQVPITAKASTLPDAVVFNSGDVSNTPVNSKKEVRIDPLANSLMFSSKKLQDELEKAGNKIKHHNDNLNFLKTQKTQLDEVILDLQVSLVMCLSSRANAEDDNSHARNEEETIQQILKHDNSAAGIFYQLKTHHGSQISNLALIQEVYGVVATLGKVDDDNLSRLFSEYLGLRTMLAIVTKTYGVKAFEKCNHEGLVNKGYGFHGFGASFGRALVGRFDVICLDNLRPYAGEVLADDPQRRLHIPNPRLSTGDIPAGFLGFAVNMIHLDTIHLLHVTSSGFGLRETLFYNLFSRLQVYRTRAEMLLALPCISDGAVSLDGGMIRDNGVFFLGSREEVDVIFPKQSKASDTPDNYHELENQLKQKKWERERIVDDMRREQALLDQEKYNFSLKKQDLMKFMTDSSSYVTEHQMKIAARVGQAQQ